VNIEISSLHKMKSDSRKSNDNDVVKSKFHKSTELLYYLFPPFTLVITGIVSYYTVWEYGFQDELSIGFYVWIFVAFYIYRSLIQSRNVISIGNGKIGLKEPFKKGRTISIIDIKRLEFYFEENSGDLHAWEVAEGDREEVLAVHYNSGTFLIREDVYANYKELKTALKAERKRGSF